MRISVVVTSYNYGRFLPECLDSLLSQDFSLQDYEIIVVDDHSQDETEQVLVSYVQAGQIQLLRNTSNLGVAASANRGIAAAGGDYVVRVDADDYVASAYLSGLYRGLQKDPDALGCACDYQWVGEGVGGDVVRSARTHPIACGVLYHRSLFQALGGYDAAYRHMESEEMRLRLGDAYRMTYTDEVLYFYRRHGANQTLDHEARTPFAEAIAQLRGLPAE